MAAPPHLHVGPASGGGLDAHEHLARPGSGLGQLLDAQVSRPVQDGGAHQGSTTALSAVPSRWAASAAPVSSRLKRWVISSSVRTAPDRSSASAARMSAAPAD